MKTMGDRIRNTLKQPSYHIRTRDGYYQTDNLSWTAVHEHRHVMDYRTAIGKIEEARKWMMSAQIHDEADGVIVSDTKTVDGTFKPIPLTRDAFIKRWTDHYVQFFHLADTPADYTRLKVIEEELAEMAGRAWDRLPIEKMQEALG